MADRTPRVTALSVARALTTLSERVADEPELGEALCYLAEDDAGPSDPFERPSDSVLAVARGVSERRATQRREARESGLIDTPGVLKVLTSIHDRRGVDRRRQRGQLLGWRSGRRTLHPSWQFDRARGDTRASLPTVLETLRQVTSDPQSANALMSAPRDDLDGRTLVDLFEEGRIETVRRLILASADQS